MEKIEIAKKGGIKPLPKVLVSCRNKKGENNALAVAYCGNCSYDPPMVMVGIVPDRYSYDMIKEAQAFVVNITDESNKDLFNYMGSHSRRDGDKFADFGVAWSEADVINAPILDACPINIECSVVTSIKTGSHEMFIGKVEKVHASSDILNEKNDIDDTKLSLII